MNKTSKTALRAYRQQLDRNDALDSSDREARAAMWAAMLECLGAFDLMVRGNLGCAIVIDARWRDGTSGDLWTIADNGGEVNVQRINADETMRSVPYTSFRRMLDGGTMAYRVRCVVDGEEIDYARSYEADVDVLKTSKGPNK